VVFFAAWIFLKHTIQNEEINQMDWKVISVYATPGILPGGAVDGETPQYFRLADAKKVDLSEAEANNSDDWDIAFKRSVVYLNSGVAGIGSVQGCLLDPPINASRDEFIKMTDKEWAPKFDAVKDVAPNVKWKEEAVEPAIFGWREKDAEHWKAPVAKGWKLRLANGKSYAKMRIRKIGADGESITFQYAYQDGKDKPLCDDSVDMLKPGEAFKFSSGTVVEANGVGWDIKHQGRKLITNSSVSGGGKGGAIGSNKFGAKWSTIDNPGDSIAYFMDEYGEIFRTPKWYRYNVDGNHYVHPNGAVYGIKVKNQVYKVQIFSYNIFKGELGKALGVEEATDEAEKLEMRIARL
tara:strand:- start:13681 stop:14733 length:1053 start_codon:yes stop_codon:yes gene_type:complete